MKSPPIVGIFAVKDLGPQWTNLSLTILQNNILKTNFFMSYTRSGSKFKYNDVGGKGCLMGKSGSIEYYKVSITFV